jgi:superfamily II DNA or RNA helicase
VKLLLSDKLYIPLNISLVTLDKIKSALTRVNPDYGRAKAFGKSVYNIPRTIESYVLTDDYLCVMRGLAKEKAISILKQDGFDIIIEDKRVSSKTNINSLKLKIPTSVQIDAIEALRKNETGIIQLPTGVGKSITAGLIAHDLQEKALILCPNKNLADQWTYMFIKEFGYQESEIGQIYDSKFTLGDITVALPHSLTTIEKLDRVRNQFGLLVIDEAHHAAAPMYINVINNSPAKYRIAISADVRRSDRKEFLIKDMFGKIIYKKARLDAEKSGNIVPVIVRAIPTHCPVNGRIPEDKHDAERQLIADPKRMEILDNLVSEIRSSKLTPCVIFAGLRETVDKLSTRYNVPYLMGSETTQDKRDFKNIKERIQNEDLDLVIATYKAFGEGQDVTAFRSGICATPLGQGERSDLTFNQVRGRIARKHPGKQFGYLYYLWDDRCYHEMIERLFKWNDQRIEIDKDGWRQATIKDFEFDYYFD